MSADDEMSPTPNSALPPSVDSFAVLVVEDDPAIGTLVRKALSGKGYQPTCVGDAEKALAKLDSLGSTVLLIDKNLPGMNGLELLEQVRRRRDDFEAVLMTAYADVDSLVRSLELGVFQYLRKPFQLTELHAAIGGAANRLFLRLDRRAHIAELERRNRELDEALTKLRQSESRRLLSERLASIGHFAAALGHEINNPLSSAQTNVSLLQEGLPSLLQGIEKWKGGWVWADADRTLTRDVERYTGDLSEILQDTSAALSLMRQISEDLRAVTRYSTETSERFNLNEVVRTACRVVRVEARVRAKLVLELASEPLHVFGSPGRLAQVVMNLVANSAEATDKVRPNKITVRTYRRRGRVVLEVEDTGVGIPESRLEEIFEPFKTYRAEQGGTGIGLGIVAQVVQECKGEVGVESVVGKGTTFRISLPAAAAATGRAKTDAPPSNSQKRLRILFVEDNPLVRQSLGRAFARHQVYLATCGTEAIQSIEAEKPDIIVADLQMPEMDGIELYEQICARWPDLARRMVFISGTEALIRRASSALPSLPLFRKPFEVKHLEQKILELAAGSGTS